MATTTLTMRCSVKVAWWVTPFIHLAGYANWLTGYPTEAKARELVMRGVKVNVETDTPEGGSKV